MVGETEGGREGEETHGGSIYNSSGGVSSAGRGVLCVSRVCAFAAACRAAQTFVFLSFLFLVRRGCSRRTFSVLRLSVKSRDEFQM